LEIVFEFQARIPLGRCLQFHYEVSVLRIALYQVKVAHQPYRQVSLTIEYVGYSHGEAVLYSHDFLGLDFRVEQIQMNEGDLLVGFTDGATDAKNSAGKLFTEERLLKSIAAPWTSIFSMFFELNTELHKHIGNQNQFDDITLISFRRKLIPDIEQHAICRVAIKDNLGELRNFAMDAASHCGLSHDNVFAFKLATEEICANIIQYGFEGIEPGLISLFFDVEGSMARVTIRDDGKYFSPEQAKTPDLEAGWEEKEIGGLGLFLVKELMDNVTYERTEENVNQFVLEKGLK